MSVDIDPSELGFRRPFTVEVSEVLKIKNPNSFPVAFKVKTTAPKQYCVRPNSGRIEPDHEVEVSVLLQAMKQEPPADMRCRDKFLVQSVGITGDKEFVSVSQIWDSVDKSSVQERKIRVNWLPWQGMGDASHNEVSTPARRSNGAPMATPDDRPPSYSPPGEDVTAADILVSPEPASAMHSDKASATEFPKGHAGAGGLNGDGDDLKDELRTAKAQLAAAQAENKSLKQHEGELRQRKGTSAGSANAGAPASQAQAVRQGTEGVPVHVVAVLCMLCFLLAYFLF